jgi:hypothetical protein
MGASTKAGLNRRNREQRRSHKTTDWNRVDLRADREHQAEREIRA